MKKNVLKKTKKLGDKFIDIVYWLVGSWWAVIIHTLWFALWLFFRLNINVLTLIVSLEAIYIGIFILMASDRAERARDFQRARRRKVDEKRLKYDIKLDEKADRQLTEIKRLQKEIDQKLDGLKIKS